MNSRVKFMGTLVAAVGAVATLHMPSAYADPPCDAPVIAPSALIGVEDRIQRLEDVKQIEELKAQYGNALDNVVKDSSKIDDLLNLLTDDICVDYGPFGRFRGKAAIKTLFQVTVPTITAWNFHVASAPLIRVNGTNASGTWQVIANAVYKFDYAGGVQSAFARYQDVYSKTASGWKFRTIIVLFETPPTGP